MFPGVASALGVAYALAGRVAEALPLLEQAVEQAPAMGHSRMLRGSSLLSEGYLLAGRPDEARPAEQALALAREHQATGHAGLGPASPRRDRRASCSPEVEPAAASYRQALALAEELGMRPLQAHCHRGLGTLYATTGQREQARAELSTAIDIYRAMEMTFWLPETEAALAQVEGR